MISYIIPTRNRPQRLLETLRAINSLGVHDNCGGAEVIIVDNDSCERPILPRETKCGLPISYIRLRDNIGAAARNVGADASDKASDWLVMLDDDSYPDDAEFFANLQHVPSDVAAVSADIFLPGKTALGHAPREMGGLPEVFIGCGAAIRRGAFLELGGYDASFNYYVEEYDLAARMMLAGYRIAFSHEFTVQHDKDLTNRDFNLILSRLVRNNGWIAGRYAPDELAGAELREVLDRYAGIARIEGAEAGYAQGLAELHATLAAQPRRPLNASQWERFTGLSHVREHLSEVHARQRFQSATIVDAGKNAWAVAQVLKELGVRLIEDGEEAEAHVIGTLSPGPMMDSLIRRTRLRRPQGPRLLAPWLPAPLFPGAKTAIAAA